MREHLTPIRLPTWDTMLQLVVRLVRMEELWMQEPVCVAVWMASVDLVVKVSALFGSTD